jgi:uncharacterized protein DUF4336
VSDRADLVPFVPGCIWTVEQPFSFLGVPMGARMTVVRLESGGLWVHSPLAIDAATHAELEALGPVTYVVAPNRLHYRCLAAFRERYPDARYFASPGLAGNRRIPFDEVLRDAPEQAWSGEIYHTLLHGHLFFDEVIFRHEASQTLILTDLMMLADHNSPWLWRRVAHLAGVYERPGPPLDLRCTFRDRDAARNTVEQVLAWPFERIVFAHGQPIAASGKDIFRRAFAFLLDA